MQKNLEKNCRIQNKVLYVPVCWRISREANEWIRRQAKEQGVSVAAIVDELVETYEELAR